MQNKDANEIRARRVRFGDRWMIDFASCNYLGFDLSPDIIESVTPALRCWGLHPSWSRHVASPHLYCEVEEILAALVGYEDTLIFPSVSLVSFGVIPLLAGDTGVVFLEESSHINLHEASKVAKANGSRVLSFCQYNVFGLEESLRQYSGSRHKIILVDGVHKMTGNYAELDRLTQLAREYDALLYIDDAHGFGIVGEHPDEALPYGYKGNGLLKHFGKDHPNIIYVGGLSKAYSAPAAFIACSKTMKDLIKRNAFPYFDSGPCSIATLQTLLGGLSLNVEQGDLLRRTIHDLTTKIISSLRQRGLHIENRTNFPIISLTFGSEEQLLRVSQNLWETGILTTLLPEKNSLRITVTAANTTEEVDILCEAFRKVRTPE